MAYPWFEAPWGRVDFTIDQLRHLLDLIEGELRRGEADESEETERLSRAVEATFGEDVSTDADVEFTAERFGEDPDMPGVPFYAFGSLFPRVTRYAFVMLATMLLEGELRLCCSALAADRGLNKFQEQGRVAVLEQLRRYLERTVGLSASGDLWRRCGEVAKVRNCIAHHGGRLSKPSETLRQIIDADADLSLEQLADPPMLVIHPGYCEEPLISSSSCSLRWLWPMGSRSGRTHRDSPLQLRAARRDPKSETTGHVRKRLARPKHRPKTRTIASSFQSREPDDRFGDNAITGDPPGTALLATDWDASNPEISLCKGRAVAPARWLDRIQARERNQAEVQPSPAASSTAIRLSTCRWRRGHAHCSHAHWPTPEGGERPGDSS